MLDAGAGRASGTTLQRYAPLLSFVFAAASFVLTLLLVIPRTSRGSLEDFHLITLNTSNIGAEVVKFTPIITQTAAVQHQRRGETNQDNGTSSTWNPVSGMNTTFSSTPNSTRVDNSTEGIRPSSMPSSNLTMTVTSSQPPAPATTAAADPFTSIVQSFETTLEGALAAAEGDIGAFVLGLFQNITGNIESGLAGGEGELGQFLNGVFQNATAGLVHGSSFGTLIGEIIASLTSGAGNSLTTSGGGLTELFSSIVGNFTAGLDSGLSKAEDRVAEGITNALGIEEFYSIHLREVCAGNFSDATNPRAKVNVSGCYSYYDAASGLARLITSIPSSTTVLTTNISIPAIAQVQDMSLYLGNLTNTLDSTIFAFYIISLVSSGLVVIGSLAQFILSTSSKTMHTNLVASTVSVVFSLSASSTATAFITTANNIVNLFGSALGLKASLGTEFLVLTWVTFAASLLGNVSLLVVWFVEFRTISVKVERRRSPQNNGIWRGVGVFSETKGGFVESVGEVADKRAHQQANTARRLSSRHARRGSKFADF